MQRILLRALGLVFLAALAAGPVTAQSTSLDPVSRSTTGAAGDGESIAPSVSADGRFVVFQSEAANLAPGDDNGVSDVFLHDRQTGETRLISVSPRGEQGNGPSKRPQISGNGRVIVFESRAANLVEEDGNGVQDIYQFDRLTGLLRRVSLGRLGQEPGAESRGASIDSAGRYLVYETEAGDLALGSDGRGPWVMLYDSLTGNVVRIASGGEPTISGDGRYVAYVNERGGVSLYFRVLDTTIEAAEGGRRPVLSFDGSRLLYAMGNNLYRFDRGEGASVKLAGGLSEPLNLAMSGDGAVLFYGTGEGLFLLEPGGDRLSIWRGAVEEGLALSANGEVLAFGSSAVDPTTANSQIYVREMAPQPESFNLAGRVTDLEGRPLALVTVTAGDGSTTRSDADGYFYLGGFPAGALSLTPEKMGYEFEPAAWNLSVFRDVAGYLFTASPEEKLLEEARLDLGMPYDFDRGCDDPYEGCGKRFHGFAAGYCTDLVLDAYTFGLEFDINYALQQDAYAFPEHFYRWRDARNVHDMWRYFHYTGQMLDHAEDYLPGDIVFFDWSGDGEIDHVALVSKVLGGRPVEMVDATGVIEENPSGLAAELGWMGFHEATVRGHARWDGSYEPVRSGYPPDYPVMQTALSGEGLFMRVLDPYGKAVSFGESSLAGAVYFDLDWEEVISLPYPAGRYRVEVRSVSGSDEPFIFSIQTLSRGRITGRAVYTGIARPGEVVRYDWSVREDGDGLLALVTGAGLRHARISGKLRKP